MSGLIYIEYISRRAGVAIADFQSVVGAAQAGWASENHSDNLLFNIGRTWRIGPEPEYLSVWHSPDSDLERLDSWQAVFRAGGAAAFEGPMSLVARLDRAGCYRPLLFPHSHRGGKYYIEYFERAPGANSQTVTEFFQRRSTGTDATLSFLILRIGCLGPDPEGLALWVMPSYQRLSTLVADWESSGLPARLVTSGLYADLGSEIL